MMINNTFKLIKNTRCITNVLNSSTGCTLNNNRYYSTEGESTTGEEQPDVATIQDVNELINRRPLSAKKIKQFYSIKPEAGSIKPQDMDIINTIRTNKTKIVAMPFDFSLDAFYKNKRATKTVTRRKKHLNDFGAKPNIFPESMFRDYYMKPIPYSVVTQGNQDK
ncbi:hypothetical protein CYY_006017 [Polysphondylium violaceum]|uniref:Uncharacterized protein n=1 Tax=Polysphondylium violaceum TaxID=133409 RepID=A0A8J4PS05_9MYCE|nr:hypothetical protein CYY_006017 [Polysphondylium violaceum]